jgi:hypothetical protein
MGKWPARHANLTIKTVIELFRLFRDPCPEILGRGDQQLMRSLIEVLDPGEDLTSILNIDRVISIASRAERI